MTVFVPHAFLLWQTPAHAASGDDGNVQDNGQDNRAIVLSPQDLRAKINAGGPEDWPESSALSTSIIPASSESLQDPSSSDTGSGSTATVSGENPARPPSAMGVPSSNPPQQAHENAGQAVSQPVAQSEAGTGAPGTVPGKPTPPHDAGQNVSGAVNRDSVGLPAEQGEKENAEKEVDEHKPEVIYVDEKGNPVPKPPEPDKMLAEAERLIEEKKYDEALPQLEEIRALPDIPQEMREKVLYYISDCIWFRYADNPLAGYEAIVSSTNEAMNANLRAQRVPDAMLRLALANINVGNLADAGGYMTALYRRHPDFPGVAQGFTALGVAQLKAGKEADAEQSFSTVLDKYPESSLLQAASVGLGKALFNQKKYDRARVILDFISKRWPRYYIEDPDFLLLLAKDAENQTHIDAALDQYWLYFNLEPNRENNDGLLLKMADTYLQQGKVDAAKFVYQELMRRFSSSPLALTAKLRLAENGIYESPITYAQMSKVFAQPGEFPLWPTYEELVESSKTDPDAVLARLKQAMWLFWDKRYTETMGKAADFIDAYPDHHDVPEARELIWQAFQKDLGNSMAEQNYGRILILWNGFPLVRERYGELDPKMRYALAQGWLERGDDGQAFGLLGEFLKSPMDPTYGEAAFTEFFNRYLKAGAWEKILDLSELVSTWPLKPQIRKQLDYAMALSAQNLNLAAPALAMWQKLAAREDIPLYQQAYATYFLARDAENRKDIKQSYDFNCRVIDLFTRLQDERSDKADPQRIKEAIASLMDICEVGNRVPEALQWLKRYNSYVPSDSPEYPGLRFREARLYRKLGDTNRSQALLEDIVRNYAQSPFAQAAQGELKTFEVSRDLQNYLPGGGQPQGQQQPSAQRRVPQMETPASDQAQAPAVNSNSTWSWQQPEGEQTAGQAGQPQPAPSQQQPAPAPQQ